MSQLLLALTLLVSDSVDDRELALTIQRELQQSPVAAQNTLSVSVTDGIVVLSGDVFNLAAQQTAVRRAADVRGVRSVVDLVELAPVVRGDQQLTELIKRGLAANAATRDEDVRVEVHSGVVTLSGSVHSRHELALVERIVESTSGVTRLENRLRVDMTIPRTDEDLKHDILEQIQWDARLDGRPIDVDVQDGVVTVRGRVGSDEEKLHASIVLMREDAREIQNRLVVDASLYDPIHWDHTLADVSDEQIEKAIRDAWKLDPRIEELEATLTVVLGSVTIHGTVGSLRGKQAAEETALSTYGVKHVKNFLQVKNSGRHDDNEIRLTIETAFAEDPIVDRAKIDVRVVEGEVYLTGKVPTHYEHDRAEHIAIHVPGVRELHDRLEVSRNAPEFDLGFYTHDPVMDTGGSKLGTIHIKPDADIKAAIESELYWSPNVDSKRVKVTVRKGTATLTGTVRSTFEAISAVENAMQGGAVVVRNQLKIRNK